MNRRRLTWIIAVSAVVGSAAAAHAQTDAADAGAPDAFAATPDGAAAAVAPTPPPPAPPAPVARSSPPSSDAPPLAPRPRRALLMMPFLGLHSFQDSNNSGFDPGLRVGALFGRHLTREWSLNAGVLFDRLNPSSPPGFALSGQQYELSFSPLFHGGNAQVAILLGPKLGMYLNHFDLQSAADSREVTGLGEGWLIGGNLGLLVRATSFAAGVLLSIDVRDYIHQCTTTLGTESCSWSSGSSSTVAGFALALLL